MLSLGDAAHSDPAPNAQQLALPPIPPASREGQAEGAGAQTIATIVEEARQVIEQNKK